MQHNYFCKHIGALDHSLLDDLKKIVVDLQYTPTAAFPPNVILVNLLSGELYERLMDFFEIYFDRSGAKEFNIARMTPMSYLLEHSDMAYSKRTTQYLTNVIKMHVPIITNDKNGMMWLNSQPDTPLAPGHVEQFKEGGIYIIDNIRKHCAVNLSDEYRYYLTVRYTEASLKDKTILD